MRLFYFIMSIVLLMSCDDSAEQATSTDSVSVALAQCEASLTDSLETPGNECSQVVACGDELSCDICCMQGFGFQFACDNNGVCEEGFLTNQCDGPEDCPGPEICCSVPAQPATCTVTSMCEGKLFCHTDADCVGQEGTQCKRHPNLDWWGFCEKDK